MRDSIIVIGTILVILVLAELLGFFIYLIVSPIPNMVLKTLLCIALLPIGALIIEITLDIIMSRTNR